MNQTNDSFIKAWTYNDAVYYKTSSGEIWSKTGGSKAWRHTNPGNMKSTPFTARVGSIGTGEEETYYKKESGTRYAIFSDWNSGKNAIKRLLQGSSYRDLNIEYVIERYAPTATDEVKRVYAELLHKCTNNSCSNKLVKDFTAQELSNMIDGIIKMEGYTKGIIRQEQ